MSESLVGSGVTWRSHVGIPVRNLWMLLVYASDLAGFREAFEADVDGDAELADLLARLLVVVVERRLRRSLSRGYEDRQRALPRVRGQIDWLATEAGLLLRRGQVACRYQDLTHDTPRNRLVRAALEAAACQVRPRAGPGLPPHGTRARPIGCVGGGGLRAEMSRDQVARHDADDRLMMAVARLALDLVLPSEAAGTGTHATRLQRDEALLRRIFKRAVAGLYRHELHGRDGWTISPQKTLRWQVGQETVGMAGRLPTMAADVVLQRGPRRIVLDTKFTNALKPRPYGGLGFDSAHIYQLYAYLRSQGGAGDTVADAAEGVLLYPMVDEVLDEAVVIQGHRLRFVAVDLSAPSVTLREALLNIVRRPPALY